MDIHYILCLLTVEYGDIKTLAYLIQDLIERNDSKTLRLAYEQGVDPNMELNSKDETAMHLAAKLSNPDILEILFDFNADPLIQDYNYNTPLETFPRSPIIRDMLRDYENQRK